MSRKAERLRLLDGLPPPDLWPDIREREARQLPASGRHRGRLMTVIVALAVAMTGIGFVVRTFSNDTVVRQPGPSVTNGLLAFASGGDVWVVNPDGSGLRNVTNTRRPADAPDGCSYEVPWEWSPDGTRLALYGSCDPPSDDGGANYDVIVMNADGSGRLNLTTSPEDIERGTSQLNPHWAPDGTRIVFDDDHGLYVVDADGSGSTKIADGSFASWSPDGSRIVFVARDGNIYTANADGTMPTRIAGGDPGWVGLPSWSPRGDLIAFVAGSAEGETQLEVVAADGSGRRRLTDIPNDGIGGSSPSWSPDGTMIAIEVHRPGGSWDIYVVGADGSGATQVTNGEGDENRPTWAPDGTNIAFMGSPSSESNNSGTFDVYVVNPDGTNLTRLTDGPGAAPGALTWQSVLAPIETVEPIPMEVVRAEIVATLDVGAFPRAVAVGEGAVWVAVDNATGGPEDHVIVRIDPATNEIVSTIPLAGASDVAVGAGAVWVASDTADSAVLRIDPSTDEVIAAIPLGWNPTNIEFGEGAVWVTVATSGDPPAGEVVRIDPETEEVVARIAVGEGWPRDIAIGEGSVWVYGHSRHTGQVWVASSLWRIDPTTNELVATVLDGVGFLGDGGFTPDNVAVGDGWVWAADVQADGMRIDPRTGAVTRFPVRGGFGWPFMVHEGWIWFGNREIVLLDPVTFEASPLLDSGVDIVDLALDTSAGTLWVAGYEDRLVRIRLN